MAWVAKVHSAHPVPTPCYVQGRQPAAQAAQSHISMKNEFNCEVIIITVFTKHFTALQKEKLLNI